MILDLEVSRVQKMKNYMRALVISKEAKDIIT